MGRGGWAAVGVLEDESSLSSGQEFVLAGVTAAEARGHCWGKSEGCEVSTPILRDVLYLDGKFFKMTKKDYSQLLL